MNNNKQITAVEWLAEEIMANPFRIENDRLWDKAKEMEKEIICTAYLEGIDDEYTTSEQYYNKTFKNTKE